MRRSHILMLLSSLACTIAACTGGHQQPAESPDTAPDVAPGGAPPEDAPESRAAAPGDVESEEDVCADQQPTGDPPECPSGCIWDDGKQRCTQLRGVIVDQRPARPRPLPMPDVRPVPKPKK